MRQSGWLSESNWSDLQTTIAVALQCGSPYPHAGNRVRRKAVWDCLCLSGASRTAVEPMKTAEELFGEFMNCAK